MRHEYNPETMEKIEDRTMIWQVISSLDQRLDRIEEKLSIFKGKEGSVAMMDILALEHVHKMVKEKLKND